MARYVSSISMLNHRALIGCISSECNTGSTLHALRCLQHPRWEDFTYERIDPVENRMYWLGDGQTWYEKTLTGDREFV